MTQLVARVRSSKKESEGFSLIEVLLAMLLVTLVMLALLEAVTLYVQSNMANILRDEAVRITQDALYDARSKAFTSTPQGTTTTTVNRSLRSSSTKWAFNVQLVVTNVPPGADDLTADHKALAVTTTWTFLGKTYTHQANGMMPRQ